MPSLTFFFPVQEKEKKKKQERGIGKIDARK